ncbi:M23 family metallopeptidase [Corynebacterium sp. 13CS0277]|uniref:M23 family metallopeptidase n=1 Tax=Corynebacterium sp. 13CS0277 TaxID=2071994 RepID=UPI0013050175|nr:M23 family metallopeptidase [Corynebacterium sp. 13CS0277]
MRKKIWVFLVALVLFLVLFVVVLGSGEDKCEKPAGPRTRGTSAAAPVTSDGLAYPIDPATPMSSGYGPRDGGFHYGVDLAGPHGTPLYAYADGVVKYAQDTGVSGFGGWVVIDHVKDGQSFATVYGHIDPGHVYVAAGQQVRAGDHIADEGNSGASSGPHLHFEVHPGTWNSSSGGVDPTGWLEKAKGGATDGASQRDSGREHVSIDPGDGIAVAEIDDDNWVETPSAISGFDGNVPTIGPGEELPHPREFGVPAGEGGLRIDTKRGMRIAAAKFHHYIKKNDGIGGVRPDKDFPDHPGGFAIDIMVDHWDSTGGQAHGTEIKDWFFAHRHELNIKYMIWQQTYIPSEGEGNLMADRGTPRANHFDHVHITFHESPFATADEPVYMVEDDAGDGSGYTLSDRGCGTHGGDHASYDLAPGTVPEEFERWFAIGAQVCPEVDAPMLAAQMQQESAFQKGAVSGMGAMGYAQFIPKTWQAYGYPVDDDGNPTGPAGAGDPNSPGDAVMAQAHYMCDLADQMREPYESGQLRDFNNLQEVILAAYNRGPYGVLEEGGMPESKETRDYVRIITGNLDKYKKGTK